MRFKSFFIPVGSEVDPPCMFLLFLSFYVLDFFLQSISFLQKRCQFIMGTKNKLLRLTVLEKVAFGKHGHLVASVECS